MGRAHLKTRGYRQAVALLERALAICDAGRIEPSIHAQIRFFLAQALWESRKDRKRARALATRAREVLAKAGKGSAHELAEVEDWLAKH